MASKNAVARNANTVPFKAPSCTDAPVATTSKGEPPPEPAFDSWLFAVRVCVGSGFLVFLLDELSG